MADLGVLAQSLDPAVHRGEAETLTITGSFTASPAAYALAFKMRLIPGDTWLTVTTPTITIAVTGSGPYSATFTVPLTAAQTTALSAGLQEWLLMRTDSGSETALAAGTQLVI